MTSKDDAINWGRVGVANQHSNGGRGCLFPAFYLQLSSALLMCLVLPACVGNQSYRRGNIMQNQLPPVVEPAESPSCTGDKAYQCVHTSHGYEAQRFYLAHIEFDDMGELWSIGNLHHDQGTWQSQLSGALATIDKVQRLAAGSREVVVIAFVHGWHNNASAYDEEHKDLGDFKAVLQDLSQRYSIDYPDRPPILVGVFMSWRGQVLSENLFSSYWNRRDAASRVGGQSLTEAVLRLMFQTKGVPLGPTPETSCVSIAEKPTSHFIVIGHSFGGRALEHGIDQPLLSLILERQAQTQECMAERRQKYPDAPSLESVAFVAPADLVVFLNAANDSLEMKSTIEALKRSGIKVLRRNEDASSDAGGPFMISITSDGDWATEIIMPIAQWVSSPGLAFRKYDSDACQEGQLCNHGQSYYYRHSAASIYEMRSHTVYDQDMNSSDCQHTKGANGNGDPWPYFIATVNGAERCFKIEENRRSRIDKAGMTYAPWNNTPAFVISVPKTLIPSHTDIFQDGTEEFLITIANHYEALTAPTFMATPAKTAP